MWSDRVSDRGGRELSQKFLVLLRLTQPEAGPPRRRTATGREPRLSRQSSQRTSCKTCPPRRSGGD